ncbi:MAG: hypothetical protein WC107_06110 [Patescibacteria group bacterium]
MSKCSIPHDTERRNGQPLGLYQRYTVTKTQPAQDGPGDPNAVYFVLRLDAAGKDPVHIRACQRAALAYAQEIRHHIPRLADELVRLVAKLSAELELRDVMERAYWRDAEGR